MSALISDYVREGHAHVLSADTLKHPSLQSRMIAFFVRPWEIYENGETIEILGKETPFSDVRKQLYERIVDEALFVSRASEGAVSAEWIMNQPIFIRKKYVQSFTEELKARDEALKRNKR